MTPKSSAPTGRIAKLAVSVSAISGRERPNSTAQMIEVDGMKSALALLAERWTRDMPASAKLMLLIYDEIDVECDRADVEQAVAVAKDCMELGMAPQLEQVPVKIDHTVGQDWAGTELPGDR